MTPEQLSALTMALVAAIGAGAMKFAEWLTRKSVRQADDATALRRELREEVRELREEVRKVRAELDQWRDRYYRLVAEHNDLQARWRELSLEYADLKVRLAEAVARLEGSGGTR